MYGRMKLDVKYYADYTLKKVVATTQRTASVSMIEALEPMCPDSPAHKINQQAALQLRKKGWPVLLWIRNPFDRLASAYSIFGVRSDFNTFIERVLGETNPHWSPVSQLHKVSGVFLPTIVYPFENLAASWASEFPKYKLEHLDRTLQPMSWGDLCENSLLSTDSSNRLLEHFHDDFALYRWAKDNGVHEVAA